MALFPPDKRMKRGRDEDRLLSRWPVFAAALLIAALFGLLSGVVKDAQFPRGIQSADKGTDAPHLSKREPLRSLVATDRKEGTSAQSTSADGALVPGSAEITFPFHASAITPNPSSDPAAFAFWPGSLPRAPPVRA
ncbi:hypothetical protein ABK249_12740 [Neorhizobium sp. Rsf11]|uniref:Transmembrane protein n=1 Tax=Neorhizobium phenanthreniclasticum TaxID=3157917 RepID=A0ABV0M1R0_9HYPH